MGEKPEWRGFAAIGTILVAITFTDLSPKGPWNDATFTSGSIGLIGLSFIYLAWFRLTLRGRELFLLLTCGEIQVKHL